jgi:hypothetical protein
MFGEQQKLLVASHVFGYLTRTMTRLWLEAKKEHGFVLKDKISYERGLVLGLRKKLQEQEVLRKQSQTFEQTGALVRVDNALATAFDKHLCGRKLSNTTASSAKNTDAVNVGRSDGAKINLFSAVKSGTSQKSLR